MLYLVDRNQVAIMSDKMKTYAIWAGALAVIGLMFSQFMVSDNFKGDLSIRNADSSGDVLAVHWDGRIAPPLLRKLDRALGAHGSGKRRLVLSLNSPGGWVVYGKRVIKRLRALRASYAVDTVVERGMRCASMCVDVFLQGQNRFAHPDARFMIHEVGARSALTNKKGTLSVEEIQKRTERNLQDHFVPAGVRPEWLAKLHERIRDRDLRLTARELVDEKSGIVTRLLE